MLVGKHLKSVVKKSVYQKHILEYHTMSRCCLMTAIVLYLICAGDVNFSSDLSDLRHRKNLNVILVHNKEVHNSLTACANRTVLYDDLTRKMQQCEKSVDLVCIHIKYITRKVWSKFKSMF